MKKITSLLLVLLFVFGFVACNGVTTQTPTTQAPSTQAPTTQAPTTETPTTQAPTTVDNAPVFLGVEDLTIQEDEEIDVLANISAVDDIDGVITDSIEVTTDLDNTTIGVYTVNLSVTDSGGNTTTTSFTVTVVQRVLTREDKALLDLNTINLVYPGLTLPSWGSNGSTYTWTTSDPTVVTLQGFVINPPVGHDAVEVTLTVRVNNAGYIISKDFVIVIPANPEVEVTSRITLPFEGTSEEYIVENQDEVDIFYVDNGSVPYIDIETFLNLINGAIVSNIISYSYPEDDVMVISYDYEYEDEDEQTVIETQTAVINFTDNTFTVQSFDFFSGYIAPTESNYGEGLNYVDYYFQPGNEVVIPLGRYNVDLVIHEDNDETFYLMPLHIANRLFAGSIYYDVYYNGDKLWGIDTWLINSTSSRSVPPLVTQIQTSSLNTEVAPLDMRWATYHYLAFVMDYFYGLKPDKGYETFYDRLYAYARTMITGADTAYYNQIFRVAYGLDDLHTSYTFDGYWQPPRVPGISLSDLGTKSQAFYNYLYAIQDSLEAKFGSLELPSYSLINNDTVAVIHLTGFTIDTPNDFKAILDSLPATVEDVVVDLSYNTGGNIGAVFRIFGYMTEETFMYHSQNPADGSASTYYIESDYVAYDYNWYVLTSGVTFSAANLFASMAKELGIPVVGQKSSGGACSIGAIVNPDGSVIVISTNNVLSTRSGNEIDGYVYTSVESGVPVDIYMSDVTSNQQLINVINQIKASQE